MYPQTVDPPPVPHVTREFVDLPRRADGSCLRMHVTTAGQGPPLLLLHGAPQTHLAWSALLPRYAAYHRVICPDLRGAGWTEAPGRGYSPSSLQADLKGLLEVLGLSKVRIVAHDWSAIIAFLLATEEPELIERLVILSVPDLFVKADARVLRLLAIGWFDLVLPLPMLGPLAVRGGRQSMLRYMQSMTGPAFAGAHLPHADLDRRLLRDPQRARDLSRLYRATVVPTLVGLVFGRYRKRFLSVPTLQLIGADDPAALLLRMGRHHGRAASLESQQIPGASHFLLDEAGDEIFQRTMRFLHGEEPSPRASRSDS